MFNVENTGKKISALRKGKNMTQMELADILNISFQAVSNWERGNSMPDISKLPETAEILDVSVDELLGDKSELLENIINNRTEEYLESNSVSSNELLDIAPLLKPEQVDTIFKHATPPFDLSEISGLLPFISQDIINQLAKKAVETNNHKGLAEIAPFVNRAIIGELAVNLYEKRGLSALEDLAPFTPKDILNTIAEKEFEKEV